MNDEEQPLEDIYFFWMDKAMKAQRKATNKLFKELGISLTADQWIILKRLSEEENLSQRELSEAVSKDPASITRSLDILEKDGLIFRQSADRRKFLIQLTKEGKALVKKVIPEAIKYRRKGIEGVSEQELRTFKKVLDTIYLNFNK